MNVKVSKRVLENALRMLLEEDRPAPSSSPDTAPPPSVGVDPLAEPEPTDSKTPEKPPEPEKTLEQKFDEKVKSLESAPEGQTLAVGNVKFVKRAGKWEISSSGDKGAIDKETLLGLVADAAQEDIAKKIAADDKARGTLGVTVRGDQFIETTEKAANFVKDDKGYYRDITPVPVQILAQYVFQEETGEDTGAVRASLARAAGESLLVYRTDKLMYVIDPGKGDIYILSIADNVDNPLQATSNLLDQLDKEGRIRSTGSTLKGFKRKTQADQYLTSLQNLRKFLNPAGDGTPFDVRIRDFQFVGDLQKALSARRTLFSKFVDLFQADELEMSFVYSTWGPAFKRARVLGSRGVSGGAGALSGTDMDALKATGLFTEETLPSSIGGKYIPDPRSELIDEPNRSERIVPVVVRKTGSITGAEATGVDRLGNALTEDYGDFYESTYADAYFLFSNGALSFEAPPVAAPEAPPAPAETAPVDPLAETCNKEFGRGVDFKGSTEQGALFEFAKTTYLDGVDKYNSNKYIDEVAQAVLLLYSRGKAFYDSSANQKIGLTVLGTADQRGKDPDNVTLSEDRCKKFIEDLKQRLDAKMSGLADKCNITFFGMGERFWKKFSDKESEDKRKYKRFVKVFWCNMDATKAEATLSRYVSEVVAAAAPAPAKADDTSKGKPAPGPASSPSSSKSGTETKYKQAEFWDKGKVGFNSPQQERYPSPRPGAPGSKDSEGVSLDGVALDMAGNPYRFNGMYVKWPDDMVKAYRTNPSDPKWTPKL